MCSLSSQLEMQFGFTLQQQGDPVLISPKIKHGLTIAALVCCLGQSVFCLEDTIPSFWGVHARGVLQDTLASAKTEFLTLHAVRSQTLIVPLS